MSKSSVIFLHISKTGGTTLRSIIQRQYAPDKIYDLDASYFTSDSKEYDSVLKQRVATLTAMSNAEKSSFDCFFQPVAYGLHEILPQSTQYLTLLRDPVDHYISNFYFTLNKPGHIHHQYVKENKVTLDNYHEHFTVDNLQTRRLSGSDPINALADLPPVPSDALAKAKQNLQNMAVFGLMEQFDLSLLMMQATLAWKDVRYVAKNVAPKRKKLSDLNLKTRQIVEEALADDIALYQFASELFEERKQAANVNWDAELARYHQANEEYKRWLSLKKRATNIMPPFIKKALKKL